MTSTTMTTPRPLPTDKILVGIVFVLALTIIAGAWGSQLIGGLVPCELCLAQRQAYYWGLPVLALILILWNRLPLAVWYIAMLVAATPQMTSALGLAFSASSLAVMTPVESRTHTTSMPGLALVNPCW